MSVKNKFISISIPLLCFGVIYVGLFTDFTIKNLLPKTPLPAKYRSYQDLGKSSSNAAFEIKKLKEKALFYNESQNILILSDTDDTSKGSTIYKMNADGLFTDSLRLDKNADYQNHYLLSSKFYYDWVITGNSEKHPYLEIESKGIKDPAKLDSMLQKNYDNATATHIYYSSDLENDSRYRYLFLINSNWYSLDIDVDVKNFDSDKDYVKYFDNNLQTYKIGESYFALPEKFESYYKYQNSKSSTEKIKFYVDYFDKKTFVPEHGGPHAGNMPHWEGVAYINYVKGRDTLKFKDENVNLMDKTHWESWEKYEETPHIYTSRKLNFAIIDGMMIKHRPKN